MTLSEIASQQVAPTKTMMEHVNQFLDYMWTQLDAIIWYRASDMILNVHSDALYLSAPKACSRAGGYFFLDSIPQDGDPIKLNGAIHITCTILKLVAASAAEAELGALFLNMQEAKVLQLILTELGHPQPPTPIHIDNATTVGIVNNTITSNGDEILLVVRWLNATILQVLLPTQPQQPWQLSIQTSYCQHTPTRQAILCPHEQLPHSLTKSYEVKHSSRVC
jgi:hypothetical protein